MKILAALALSILTMCGTALADTPKDADAQPAKPAKANAAKKAEKADSALAAEIEALRQGLQSQQEQLQLLKEELAKRDRQIDEAREAAAAANARAAEASSKATEAVSVSTETSAATKALAAAPPQDSDLTARVAVVEKDVAAQKKELPDKVKGVLGNIKFSGDARFRYEPFFSGGSKTAAEPAQRNRQRYRLRFNAVAQLHDDFTVGFSLGSGDLGDPISTNSTETGFLTRKPFAVDKVFATYNPHYFKPLSITAGKFAYTWHRTELTWDNDLNPEGASEQLMWDWKEGFLAHLGVVAFQTPMFEVSASPDTYMIGEQVQTAFRVLPHVKLSADLAYYDYANADRIAQNQNNGNGFATQGIASGLGGTFAFGGSANTNFVANIPVLTTTPASVNRLFLSKFGIVDAQFRADLDTGIKRFPVSALFNFAQNTRACENVGAAIAAGATGTPYCDPHQKHAYWAEAQFGQTKSKGDVRFGYTFMRIERDAVVAAFNFSDLRQPTNDINHRIEAFFQAYKNVTLGFTGLIGRQIHDANPANGTALGPDERWLKRLQFDMIYSF